MANNTNPTWTWSEQYEDYYYVTYDQWNRPQYHWYKATQSQASNSQAGQHQPDMRPRADSGGQQDQASNTPQMPEPVPNSVRAQQGFISGTPEAGWYDTLDQSYRMRTGQEARQFFVVGRVFSMLYIENAAETAPPYYNAEAYTEVRFGQTAYSTIRRFVVMETKRGFVYACGIGTYSGRGALKGGCDASEHTIVYFSGTDPASCYIPGEYESGMTKEPIEVQPVDLTDKIRASSRIRFSKTYPIEMNVKVKDIGRVHPGHLTKLIEYWDE